MQQRADTFIFDTVAERLAPAGHVRSFGEVALTAASFAISPEDRLYRTTRSILSDGEPELPLQPTVETVVDSITATLGEVDAAETRKLTIVQQTRFISLLIQFSDRAALSGPMLTPATQIEQLHDATVEAAQASGPVTLDRQLDLALDQTEHLPSALWNLFLTHRQYARWRDTAMIDGFRDGERHENVERMLEWERSLAAIKRPDSNGYQDSAGDAYYVWTHALGRVIYTALPEHPGVISATYAKAFEHGSQAMSVWSLHGRLKTFGTVSDHVPAQKYGNAIGDVIADKIKSQQ